MPIKYKQTKVITTGYKVGVNLKAYNQTNMHPLSTYKRGVQN